MEKKLELRRACLLLLQTLQSTYIGALAWASMARFVRGLTGKGVQGPKDALGLHHSGALAPSSM